MKINLLVTFLTSSLLSFAQPQNDNCEFATVLTPGTDIACVSPISGTVLGATASPQGNTCASTNDDDDVWYKFTATSTMHKITLSNVIGSSIDMYFVVYDDICSGAGNQLLCSDNNISNVQGLTIGELYYIRVYTKTAATGQTTNFDICITTPPAIPLNDECAGAIPLLIDENSDCDSLRFGTLTGASISPVNYGCSITLFGDVWYTFVATKTAHNITITPLNESPVDYYHSVMYGGACGTISGSFHCSDPNSSTVTGLTPGETYYLRVYSKTALVEGIVSDFNICLSNPPTPPANDECVNAYDLTVHEDWICDNTTFGTVENALKSNQTNGCYGTNYVLASDDVWFKFTATRTKHGVQFLNISGSTTAVSFGVYRGTCAGFNPVLACEYASTASTSPDWVDNLNIGETYYLRVYSNTNVPNQTTNFDVCIGSEPRPLNDECVNAINLNVSTTSACQAVTPASVLYGTLSAQTSSCTTTDQADVWYKFTASDTNHVINLYGQYINSVNALEYDVYDGTCDDLGNALLCNTNYANQIPGLTVGNEYIVKLHATQYTSTPNTYLCLRTSNINRPSNDDCGNALLVEVNRDLICDTAYVISAQYATPSSTPSPDPVMDDDVWVKFVALSSSHAITIANQASGSYYYNLYFYNSCNDASPFTTIYSSQGSTISNLTDGNTYYVRIGSTSTGSSIITPFDFCIKNADAPQNDECAGSIGVLVNESYLCTASVDGTIYKASASSEPNSCDATSDDDDVWYNFTALNPKHKVTITRTTGSSTSLRFALYSGVDCSSLTQIGCYNSVSTIDNLIPGDNYFLRVYSNGTTQFLTTNFNLCIASPPENDECSNSILVPVNPTLECYADTIGTLLNATASGTQSTCSNSTADDVWYHFEATNITHWITFSAGYGMAYSVYNYDCNNLGSPLICQNGTFYNNYRSVVTNLTPGNTYFIRIYKNLSSSAISNSFRFCVSTPDIAPPNDECVNAITIPTNNSFVCDTMLFCSVSSGITPSSQTQPTGNTNTIDVWYKFTSLSTTMNISLYNTIGGDAYHSTALYAGSCGGGTPMYFNYDNENSVTNLSVGQTYYLRVFPLIGYTAPNPQFYICVRKLPVPENDECVNAIQAPVNHSNSCDTIIPGTLKYATTSAAQTYCGGSVPVNDVWYKFTATATKHNINMLNMNNGTAGYTSSAVRINVYSGICGSLGTPIKCATTNFAGLIDLVIGNTYYVRIFNSNTTSNLELQFNLCITIPPPPVNDECINATLLSNEVDNSCSLPTAGTLNNATPSVQSNSCANTSDDDDVWYKFTASSESQAINFMNVLNNTDIYHSVYSGNCANLVNLKCSDPNSSFVDGLTVDSTYIVRIYSTSNLSQNTTFKVCTGPYLSLPTCQNSIPAGNSCSEATSLCSFDGYCGRTAGTYTTESWQSLDTTFCGTLENNSFFSFRPETDSIALNVWVTSSITNLGIQTFIFDAENCSGPVQNLNCWDPNYVPPGHKLVKVNNLIPGHKYYLMVDGQSGDICDYVISSDSPISPSVSIDAINLDLCLGDSVLLTASGGDETYLWPNSAEITTVSANQVYYKPSNLGANSIPVSSFTSNPNCTLQSEITFSINTHACICPIVAINNTDSCYSSPFDLSVNDVFGATFEWTGPNGFTSTLQNPTQIIPPNSAGEYTYSVTATTANETCTTNTLVTINPLTNASFVFDASDFCQFGASVSPTISGENGGVFSASNANLSFDISSGEINLNSSLIGNYVVTYTTSGVCPTSETFTLEIYGKPIIQAILNQEICFSDSFQTVIFTADNPSSFSWVNSNSVLGLASSGTGNILTFTPQIDGSTAIIKVIASDSYCTSDTVSFDLIVRDELIIQLPDFDTLCSSVNAVLLSGATPSGGTYSGDFVANNQFNVNTAGIGNHEIIYTYTDPISFCTASDTSNLVVDGCLSVSKNETSRFEIYPNPCSGNVTLKSEKVFSFKIYDATGKLIINNLEEITTIELNLETLLSGIYSVEISQNEGVFHEKLVICR